MEDTGRQKLLEDYIHRLYLPYWLLKLLGFGRFDITRGQIVQKSSSSIFFNLPLLFIVHFCTYYILFALCVKNNFLKKSESFALLVCLCYNSSVVINSFVNRHSGAKFLNTGVDLDLYLGAKETQFMRKVFSKTFISLSAFVLGSQSIVLAALGYTYIERVDWTVTASGFFFTFIAYFVYYDLSFLLSLYTMLTLRVRYLNVAIMKLANMKLEYLPQQFPFNSVFWKNEFDDMVDLHLRANGIEIFIKAFMTIFHQLRYLEIMCRCTLLVALVCGTFATFTAVQSWIDWVKYEDMDESRLLAIIGWWLLDWFFIVAISQQMDMFQRQIYQTTLMCTFIQLKPTYPDHIYELTARIIRVLEFRDPRISIYDLFYFDTGLLLRMMSSTLVYITMQLQIAFPKNSNATITIVNNSSDNDKFIIL